METLIIYLLKTGGLIALFWVSYQFLLSKETFFITNRWFLLAGLAASICIPLFHITKTVWIDPISLPTLLVNNLEIANAPNHERGFEWISLILTIYFIGVAFFAIRFTLQLYSLRTLIRKSISIKIGNIRLVEPEKKITPFSFFGHIIYNPREHSHDDLLTIVEHEKVHIRQFHSFDVLLAHFILIFQWFNPFMWLYRSALHQNLEFIADQGVTSNQHSLKDYQYLLLKTSTKIPNYSFTSPFFNSSVKKRIVMLNIKPSPRRNLGKYFLTLPFLAIFFMVFQVKTNAQTRELEHVETTIPNAKTYHIHQKSTKDEILKIKSKIEKGGGKFSYEMSRSPNGKITYLKFEIKNKGTGNYESDDTFKEVFFGTLDSGGIFLAETRKDYQRLKNRTLKQIVPSQKDTIEKPKSVLVTTDENNETIVGTSESETSPQRAANDSANKTTRSKPKKIASTAMDSIFESKQKDSNATEFTSNGAESDSDNSFLRRLNRQSPISSQYYSPLYLLDGKEISFTQLNALTPDKIKSINVLKGNSAILKYGGRAKDGAVEVSTKKISDFSQNTELNKNDFSQIITKKTTNRELEHLVSQLKAHKLELIYSDIVRNKNDEIIQINISIKDKTGLKSAGSAIWTNKNNPIPNILVGRINGMARVTSSQ
ncbi:M56 family metallopeptidase [Flagellimonas sp.]|uniref:M56 family metallopeptidase n=1 Tax=Flagellimonas sp. TaxID=2058762 RepID=UPI003B5991B3